MWCVERESGERDRGVQKKRFCAARTNVSTFHTDSKKFLPTSRYFVGTSDREEMSLCIVQTRVTGSCTGSTTVSSL